MAQDPELVKSYALFIMAISGAIFLGIILWKGRTFVAKYKQLEVTLNPERLESFSTKMDEVVKSVNNKGPQDPTLFQTVRIHSVKLDQMSRKLNTIDTKLDFLVTDLTEQVGLRVTKAQGQKEDQDK